MKIDYFSRTAAAAVYITITSLFWIVGLLGAFKWYFIVSNWRYQFLLGDCGR
ncbi:MULTISPECIES: hypothetical protein [Pseudidiomarina]|uniref:Uncharacterized protein n=2 Tax=Pseudidiomarina TaxID=2800384 RepID=A0A368UUQ5_9GAMM|nr:MULTISPECIES: hypothetical protein [Pseudidiomarina]PWW13334.1 hypothetical protein DET45_10647 [Pseudidiomarina maritima]RBP90801.1 hypothetical protein DFO81_10647 [Pseudidiomarina tainanensis]RCW32597.1 hypothetical protein DFO79_10647 [Pseudidiomarina tainanensis]